MVRLRKLDNLLRLQRCSPDGWSGPGCPSLGFMRSGKNLFLGRPSLLSNSIKGVKIQMQSYGCTDADLLETLGKPLDVLLCNALCIFVM